jgi:hypothetical protein
MLLLLMFLQKHWLLDELHDILGDEAMPIPELYSQIVSLELFKDDKNLLLEVRDFLANRFPIYRGRYGA